MNKLEVNLDAPLIFEYVKMPIKDLGIPFLYRFKGPIETVWTTGAFTLPDVLGKKNSYQDFALKIWDSYLHGDESEDIKDLLRRNSVSIVECEITPK